MLNSRKKRIYLLSTLAILSLSTINIPLIFAAPRDISDSNWIHVNGNSWAQNHHPQTQINNDNVDNLEIKWLFPVGSRALAPDAISSLNLAEGATTPPIVVDGVVYFTSNWLRTYAIDAKDGKEIWTNDYEIDLEDVEARLPWSQGGILHLHGFRYWEGGNALLQHGLACDFFGIDADSGETTLWVKDLCADVPGNIYDYRPSPSNTATIGTYEAGNQFIIVLPGRMHSTLFGGDSRHVTLGIDMDTQEVLWRVFSAPPQDMLVKDWALEECDIGFFHDEPCTEVAAVNREGLEWDFALEGERPSMYAGVTANWGQLIVDEDTGILYTQTGNQGPYSNMTLAPGPRLYGSTIMAIDMDKGERKWWLQPFPHDPYDYDCNWSGILADNPTLGKVYIKGCKEGVFYVMDAETGEPLQVIDSLDEMVERGQIGDMNGPMYKYYRPDPKSFHDMREWNWISWPAAAPGEAGERFTLPATIIPSWTNGHFVTDMSFDPETQTLYHFAAAAPRTVNLERSMVEGASLFSTTRYPVANETLVARDLATGDVKWTWFYDFSQTRAAMTVRWNSVHWIHRRYDEVLRQRYR
jgi:outer membrane protein assembly factor BamB